MKSVNGGGPAAWIPGLLVVAMLAAPVVGRPAAPTCQFVKWIEFPITMTDRMPMVQGQINGADAKFIVNSGYHYSAMTDASAARYGIKTFQAPAEYQMGKAGSAQPSVAKVNQLAVGREVIQGFDFLVGGSDDGSDIAGVLGQNFLLPSDVEYDFSAGALRLFRSAHCDNEALAYWTAGTTTRYSVINARAVTRPETKVGSRFVTAHRVDNPDTSATGYVNGSEIRVRFDSGQPVSLITRKAAVRAGVNLDPSVARQAGDVLGLGKGSIPSYIVPVASFKLGDEEIHNTQLRVVDADLEDVDMLLGADFFLSHRILVANSQRKIYFTYGGGPIFNLATMRQRTEAKDPESREGDGAGDAADNARRGAAAASRREYAQALELLDRACELAPDNVDYRYLRGQVHWFMGHREPAKIDLDQALRLKPDHVGALLLRGQWLLQDGQQAAARADLDSASVAMSKQDNWRIQLSVQYAEAGEPEKAIAELDLWISLNPDNARLPDALNARCWDRALTGEHLDLALKDCKAALQAAAKGSIEYGETSDSLGFLYLRMGEYEKSIAAYNDAVSVAAINALSMYGRGIAKLRLHRTAEGEADITQAKARRPHVADEYKQWGVVP